MKRCAAPGWKDVESKVVGRDGRLKPFGPSSYNETYFM